MSKIELIDDFLSNKLSPDEQASFEKEMNTDPSFKLEVDFQRIIVENVKKARITELKAMLNNVPVTSVPLWQAAAGKIVLGVVATSAILTGAYLYVNYTPALPQKTDTQTTIEIPAKKEVPVVADHTNIKKEDNPVNANKDNTPDETKTKIEAKKETKSQQKVTNPIQPKIDVLDPTEELEDVKTDNRPKAEGNKSVITTSKIEVDIDSSVKKYSFHYQFVNGKLVLFGNFDKGLYEILEINGDKHAVFLFYKENYYLLDEKQQQVTSLDAIKNPALIKKLKEYRGR